MGASDLSAALGARSVRFAVSELSLFGARTGIRHLQALSDGIHFTRIVQNSIVNHRDNRTIIGGRQISMKNSRGNEQSFTYFTITTQAGKDESTIHDFVLFLVQVGVGVELDLGVVFPLNSFKLVAFLFKKELYHLRMCGDTHAG
jgi:hypothetical protein